MSSETANEFGLSERTMSEVCDIFAAHARVHKAVIYGSRAMGNYHSGSDIDLTMFGDGLTLSDVWLIRGELDDSSIPYMVDLSVYDELNHAKLKDHINRVGKVFYDRFAGWEMVKLGDVCDFQNGLWRGKKEPFAKAFVFRNTNFLSNGELSFDNVAELNVEVKQLEKRQLKHGDILLEKSGGGDKTPVGRVALFRRNESDVSYSFSNFTSVIRAKDKNKIDFHYLHKFLHYLHSFGKTNDMQRRSTGIRNLQLGEYKETTIFIPPLKQQQRIVAKLDTAFSEIDAAIAAAEKKSIQIENIKAAILSNTFNFQSEECEVIKLGKELKTRTGGTPLRTKKEYYSNGNISWLMSGAVNQKEITSSTTYINKLGLDNSSAKLFPPNTILMAMYGATAGQVGILRFSSTTNQAICGIYPNENYLPDFLYFYLVSYKKILLRETAGVAQPNLSQLKIRNIPIPIISLKHQQAIVAKLDAAFTEIESASHATERKISELKALKTVLLRQELEYNLIS